MNKEIMRRCGFGEEVALVENGQCPLCKNSTRDEVFENERSKREFEISGLCQRCQNSFFK